MNFGDLPEGCIAKVISLTTPVDACRLSVVSPAFRSAVDSDTVWNEFLPSDHVSTVSRSGDGPDLMSLPSKKHLFLSLCHNAIFIDNGTKSCWLDKRSGKKCYMIAARGLTIFKGGSSQYWSWIRVPDSRFGDVAKLRYIRWLRILGKMDASRLSPVTTYIACLVFKIMPQAKNLGLYPSEVSVGVIGGKINKSAVCLDPHFGDASAAGWLSRPCLMPQINNRALGMECPTERTDGWLEIKLGEYFKGNAEVEGEILEMSLMEFKEAFKSGLIIQGIEIRPKCGPI